jgi:putative ABC transport system permease protein
LRPALLAVLPRLRDRAAVIQPLSLHLDINPRVLAFVTVATLLTALLCGLAPALANESVRGNRTTTARWFLRPILLTAQVAICVLLLAGASVLVETFRHMEQMNIGFDRNHIVTFTIDPGLRAYTPERAKALSRELLNKTRDLPGVAAGPLPGAVSCAVLASSQRWEWRANPSRATIF